MMLPKSGGGGKSLSRPTEPQALLQILNSESTNMLSFLRSLRHISSDKEEQYVLPPLKDFSLLIETARKSNKEANKQTNK